MILDKREEIELIDKSGVYDSVISLPKQAKQAWDDILQLTIPAEYSDFTNIVFLGMGGSNLGFRIVKEVYLDQLSLPAELVNGYRLPQSVNENTLVIVSSYSGNTEETLHLANLALEQKAKLFALTTGGKLAELAKEKQFPIYLCDPKHNKAGQPRLGLGYAVFSQIALFVKLGFIAVEEKEIETIFSDFETQLQRWQIESTENNQAKELAHALLGKLPIWIGADHLAGNTRVAHNITNETPKVYSSYYVLPDLNHHLMEGLKNPSDIIKNLAVVAFDSTLYHKRNQKRLEVTKIVVEKNSVEWLSYKPQGKTKLAQACEVLLLSNFIVFYLSMLYKEDPCPIPWVNFFKENLA